MPTTGSTSTGYAHFIIPVIKYCTSMDWSTRSDREMHSKL